MIENRLNAPNGVASAHTDPLRDGAVGLHGLGQNLLGAERLVGRLVRLIQQYKFKLKISYLTSKTLIMLRQVRSHKTRE